MDSPFKSVSISVIRVISGKVLPFRSRRLRAMSAITRDVGDYGDPPETTFSRPNASDLLSHLS